MYVCRLLFHMNVNMQSWHTLHINFNDIVTLYRSVTLSKCLIWWTMWPKRGWLFKNFDPNFNQYFLMNDHVCLFFKMFVFCFVFFWTRNHYHTYYELTVTHSLMIFFFSLCAEVCSASATYIQAFTLLLFIKICIFLFVTLV